MSMEALHRAATAAGYAMAAPDDDEPAPVRTPTTGRELAVVTRPEMTRASTVESLAFLSGWVRGYLPASFGGRATA